MSYKYENRYIKYNLTPLFRQNLISLMWNKDSEKRGQIQALDSFLSNFT